jgi:hypothetical protein
VSHPFLDEPRNSGILFATRDRLAHRIEPFAQAGWQIATHAIGDRAIETVLDAYEIVFGTDSKTAAPRIEHAQLLRPDLVSRMAEAGVVACIQPGFAFDDSEHVKRSIGDSWPLAYRWSSLVAAGVPVICGSDYPIDGLQPLAGLQKLLRNPFDRLDIDQALALMTDENAGTVALDRDPRTVDRDNLADIRVIATSVSV